MRGFLLGSRAILFALMLLLPSASADTPDISAARLLAGWKAEDPTMRMLAEVIASAFASGLAWSAAHGGKAVYCPSPGLTGHEAMTAFEEFLQEHPDLAEKQYGDALSASLGRQFPCPPN